MWRTARISKRESASFQFPPRLDVDLWGTGSELLLSGGAEGLRVLKDDSLVDVIDDLLFFEVFG